MKIKIKEKEYTVKYTLRALFIFEQIAGKAFTLQTFTNQYIFIYSLLLANNPDVDLAFDDFINECDDNPELIRSMQKFISKEIEKQAVFNKDDSNDDSKKKN